MIQLLVLDVDGTMTDGGITFDADGVESKTFNVKDGFAVVSWNRLGKKSAIITGRTSAIVAQRAAELRIPHVIQGCRDKLAALEEIWEKEGITAEETAIVGDDLNDYRMMRACKRVFVPADASPFVRELADVELTRFGGRGAVAEAVEYLVREENLLEEYLAPWR